MYAALTFGELFKGINNIKGAMFRNQDEDVGLYVLPLKCVLHSSCN